MFFKSRVNLSFHKKLTPSVANLKRVDSLVSLTGKNVSCAANLKFLKFFNQFANEVIVLLPKWSLP